MDVSENIKRIREDKRLKQSDVADKLGIDKGNYSRVERKGNKLTLKELIDISEALNVSLKELMFNDNDSKELKKLKAKVETTKQAILQKQYLVDSILKLILSIDNLSYTIGEKLNANQNEYQVFVKCVCEYHNEVFTLATWQKAINKEASYFISLGQDANTGEVLFNETTSETGQKHASQIKDTAFSNIQQNPDLWVINFINLTAFFKKVLDGK